MAQYNFWSCRANKEDAQLLAQVLRLCARESKSENIAAFPAFDIQLSCTTEKKKVNKKEKKKENCEKNIPFL